MSHFGNFIEPEALHLLLGFLAASNLEGRVAVKVRSGQYLHHCRLAQASGAFQHRAVVKLASRGHDPVDHSKKPAAPNDLEVFPKWRLECLRFFSQDVDKPFIYAGGAVPFQISKVFPNRMEPSRMGHGLNPLLEGGAGDAWQPISVGQILAE